MPQIEANLDRRYIAVLCVVSLVILVAGVWFRPSRTPPPIPSEFETLNVQLARQRVDLERRSLFYAQKAADLIKLAADLRGHPERVPFLLKPPGETVLLIATDTHGQPVWAASQTAGAVETPCGEMQVQEVATTIVIPVTLADAVAFDFDNNLAGLVITCLDRRILVTPESFSMWSAEKTLEQTLRNCCGLSVTGNLEVLGIENKSELATAGIRPGDTIVSVAGHPVTSRRELHEALAAPTPPGEIAIRRNDRTRRVTIRRREAPQ